MPLTGAEKTQIAQGVSLLAQPAVLGPKVLATGVAASGVPFTATTVSTLGPLSLPALAFLPPLLGLTALFGRVRFPVGGTEEELFGPLRDLERTGRRGRISSNPFTGRPVISAFDQDPHLFSLLQRRARQEQIAPLLPAFSASVLADRDAVITGLAESAVERGFAQSVEDLRDVRGGVFRRTAESPLEFVPR